MDKELQNLLDSAIQPEEDHPIYNVALLVDAPKHKFFFKGAAGCVNGQDEAMTPEHKFRISSMTKPFTAAVTLQLIEERAIKLKDRIVDVLYDCDFINFEHLQVYHNKSYAHKITIKDLLQHKSGLRNYLIDDTRFIKFIRHYPTTQWSPKKLLEEFYKQGLNRKSVGKPGKKYYYSDTGYLLLGLAIERITGKPLHQCYTERIFQPLNMPNSYLEFYQTARGPAPMSFPYHDHFNTKHVNTSFDWGGAGIVSTLTDTNIFLRSLLKGRLFKKKKTLKRKLLRFTAEPDIHYSFGLPKSKYGLGVRRIHFYHFKFIGHSGTYGSLMYYDKKRDISICMTINQDDDQQKLSILLHKIIRLLILNRIY